MPSFRRDESALELPEKGIYYTQIISAERKFSRKGNEMIRLTHRSIPVGYRFFYHLVFCPECEGMITRFCHACEGGLLLPHDAEPGAEFSLTAVDCLYR